MPSTKAVFYTAGPGESRVLQIQTVLPTESRAGTGTKGTESRLVMCALEVLTCSFSQTKFTPALQFLHVEIV